MPEGGKSRRGEEILLSKGFIPILNYHQITDKDLMNDPYAVSVSKFERQMNYNYEHGYQCLSLIDVLRIIEKSPTQLKKTFVLTFDDGYADFYKNAYPILQRNGFTATVFIVTDYVGKESQWEGGRGNPLLNWDEIKALHKAGVFFGSHTCTHPRLTQISSDRILYELKASKEKLEAELGEEIQFLAYPYGESSSEIQRIAKDLGYIAAFGVNTGRNGRFNLWRSLCLTHDSLLRYTFRLSPWYHSLKLLRRWIREETALGKFLCQIKQRLLSNP